VQKVAKVIVNKYVRNWLDDWDHVALVYNRVTRRIERVIYATTRGYIEENMLDGLDEAPTAADYLGAAKCLVKEFYEANKPRVGDILEITKGRKYPKGTVFKFSHTKDFADRYGRVQTVYACSEDNQIKTAIGNCRVKKLGNSNVFLELVR
jgi:hypothetical protein